MYIYYVIYIYIYYYYFILYLLFIFFVGGRGEEPPIYGLGTYQEYAISHKYMVGKKTNNMDVTSLHSNSTHPCNPGQRFHALCVSARSGSGRLYCSSDFSCGLEARVASVLISAVEFLLISIP